MTATPRRPTIQQRFEEFHKDNPSIYQELVRLSMQLQQMGYEHYSIDALFHVIRWHRAVGIHGDDRFRLNDHYTSRYARLISGSVPALKSFFRSRPLEAA